MGGVSVVSVFLHIICIIIPVWTNVRKSIILKKKKSVIAVIMVAGNVKDPRNWNVIAV